MGQPELCHSTPVWGWRVIPQHFFSISVSPGTSLLWSFWSQGPAFSGTEGKWRSWRSQSLSTAPWISQKESSALMKLSMAQQGELKILPPCTHLDFCDTDRTWSSSGRVTLPGHICTSGFVGSWLLSGIADFKFHMVTVSGEERPLQSPGPWSTAFLSPQLLYLLCSEIISSLIRV